MDERASRALDSKIDHYLGMRRYAKVIELAKEGLADDPGQARYYFYLGVCFYSLEHYREAEDHLQEALVLGYDKEAVFEWLGDVYTKTKRWVEAERAYLDALGDNPESARVHASYAMLLRETGHHDKAGQLMRKALELDPEDDYVVRSHYMFALTKDSRLQQIQSLERLIQVSGDQIAIEVHLGLDALYRDRLTEARDHFRQAFLLDPTNKELAALLEELDWGRHPILVPLRLVEKIGGPMVVYVVGLGAMLGTRALGWEQATIVLLVLYFTYLIYSWTAKPLAKLLTRIRG
ncbi:tetratricopeptide repeat protein [Paenibacillus elgii]|uniref:tetratricopeptide repeat protein n=1 Tax=Paenibacillus elgii TaxID=189691 RepID=UPI000248C242|nr:tetratricopeptide repeat protein [Paenibacillus elgii]